MQVENPPKYLTQNEKAQWNTSWARLPKAEVSIKAIVPQNLSIIPNNKFMFMDSCSKISANR
jgi:hypothetical protein